jgi:predicted amidohydrolase
MLAAAIQLNSTADKARNLERAAELVATAAQAGAELVVLPEKWNLLGGAEELHAGAESVDTGPTMAAAAGWARGFGINLVAGSIAERPAETDAAERLFNTSCLFDREGELVATYRKIHMFDVDVGGVSYRESDSERPGNEIVDAEVDGVRIGLTVCYDLRFPELYRILAVRGARVLTVPSAFTRETGRDHWEVLVRARAIENQAYVIAANQHGETPPNYDSYGRSMIADPWGLVLSQAPDGEGLAIADLDFDRLDRVRASLPSLANRMDAAYRWPEPVGAER